MSRTFNKSIPVTWIICDQTLRCPFWGPSCLYSQNKFSQLCKLMIGNIIHIDTFYPLYAMLYSLFGHFYKSQINCPESIKVVWRWLQRARLPPALCRALAPTSTVSTPKIFICYMMHESTLSWHTTLHDPWPHLHRCNTTPAATIHFGLWSRFNEFLLCCVCMSLGLALSLVLLATSESWKSITWLSKADTFSHCKTRLWFQSSEICRNRYSGSHILSLFVCFLTLNDNSNWIVTDFQLSTLATKSVGGHLNRCLL